MNSRTLLTLTALGPVLLGAAFVACSGEDSTIIPTADGGADGTTQDSGSDSSSQTDTGTDAPIGKDGGPDAGPNCANLPLDQCRACCIKAHPNVSIIVTEGAKCACTTPGLCKTECATTLCAAKAADQTCSTCLQSPDAGGCLAVATAACANDSDCAAGIVCGQGCK